MGAPQAHTSHHRHSVHCCHTQPHRSTGPGRPAPRSMSLQTERAPRPSGMNLYALTYGSWLIDKSALVRLAASPDAADWAARIERGWCGSRPSPGWKRAIRPGRVRSCEPGSSGPRCRPWRWSTSPRLSRTGPWRSSHCSPTAASTAPLSARFDHCRDGGTGRAHSAAPQQGLRTHR